MEKESTCPYCKYQLKAKPARKKKCPSCGKFIYVRTLPSTRERVLVTEKEVAEIEQQWEEYHKQRPRISFRNNWVSQLSELGIDPRKFEERKNELIKKGVEKPNERDIIWSLFNEFLHTKAKESDYYALSHTYFQMALFLSEEGRDPFRVLQSSTKMDLHRRMQPPLSIRKVQVLTARDENTCMACKALEGKVFTIEEALNQMPIPVKKCTHKLYPDNKYGWCRCCYLDVIV